MPRTSSGPRRFVSNFNLQVGPLSVVGSLTPMVATEARQATAFPYACPECEDVTPVAQGYTCTSPDQHGPFAPGDLSRSRELPNGSWVRLSEEQYVAARGSDLPPNVLRVTVHPAEQVDLIAHGTAYRFAPEVADPTFAALLALVDQSNKAFIGVANLRGHEGLFQLRVRDGNMVIEKMTWPESLNAFDRVEIEPDQAVLGAAKGMLDRITVDFEPKDYLSQQIARARALTASLAGEATPASGTETTLAQTQTREDLLAVLSTFAA